MGTPIPEPRGSSVPIMVTLVLPSWPRGDPTTKHHRRGRAEWIGVSDTGLGRSLLVPFAVKFMSLWL